MLMFSVTTRITLRHLYSNTLPSQDRLQILDWDSFQKQGPSLKASMQQREIYESLMCA